MGSITSKIGFTREGSSVNSPKRRASPKILTSDLRQNLASTLALLVSGKSKLVEIHRRDKSVALLADLSLRPVIQAFTQNDFKLILANMIVNTSLGSEAPIHLREPQLAELQMMDESELFEIFTILNKRGFNALRRNEKFDQTMVDRLGKRINIATAILEADMDDLYEAAEHIHSN